MTLKTLSITTGEIPFSYPTLPRPGKTWYRLVESNSPSPLPPLIVLHGGPGATHQYLVPTFDLLAARTGRAVLYYDQIGNGKSSHYRDTRLSGTAVWSPELFVDELRNLVEALGWKGGEFDLYGQSWGAMLAIEYAAWCSEDNTRRGPRKVVFGSGAASMSLWQDYSRKLIARLPAHFAKTILECEEKGEYTSPEWEAAVAVFYNTYLYRARDRDDNDTSRDKWPAALLKSMQNIESDDTVYITMNGPTEFTITGTMQGYDLRPRLGGISVPVLVLHGEFDEAGPEVVAPVFWEVGGKAKWVTMSGCSHSAHLEDVGGYIALVDTFLRE